MSSPMNPRLKHPAGWFAAGREVQQALILLSDSAFKLFLWLCLHADRSRGSVRVSPAELASALHKTEREIGHALNELFQHGVCITAPAGAIEIADRFWPYQRVSSADASEDLALYIAQLKRCFLQRHCVQATFSSADETLAAQLYRNGVSILDAEHAILLGSARKYVSWANNGRGTPITTLHYFRALFDEVLQTKIPASYWIYVAHNIQTFEQDAGSQFRPDQETK